MLPYAFKSCGLTVSISVLSLALGLGIFSTRLLVNCKQATGSESYAGISCAASGRGMLFFVAAILSTLNFATCTLTIQFFVQLALYEITFLPSIPLQTYWLPGVIAVALLFLCFQKDPSGYAFISFLQIISVCVFVFTIITTYFAAGHSISEIDFDDFQPTDVQ